MLTVEGPALVDDKVHGPHGLLNRCGGIWSMAEHQVHIVQTQAPKRCLHTLSYGMTGIPEIPVRPERYGCSKHLGGI